MIVKNHRRPQSSSWGNLKIVHIELIAQNNKPLRCYGYCNIGVAVFMCVGSGECNILHVYNRLTFKARSGHYIDSEHCPTLPSEIGGREAERHHRRVVTVDIRHELVRT